MHHLKMVMVKTLNHPQPLPHIRPLWLSKEISSQIFHIPCEVDTGTSSNILPLCKANALLEQISSWDNRQWILKATMTAQLRILDPVLCTFIMARKHTKSHVKWQTAKVTWSWAGSKHCYWHIYVSFPEIQQQAVKAKVDTSIKTITDKPVKPPCRTSYSSRTRMYRQEDNHRREDTSVTYNQRVLAEGILWQV